MSKRNTKDLDADLSSSDDEEEEKKPKKVTKSKKKVEDQMNHLQKMLRY